VRGGASYPLHQILVDYGQLMLPHWDLVLQPLLAAQPSGPWVEIGVAGGDTTEKLAEIAAERGFVLHGVDPVPRFDLEEFKRRFGSHFRLHRERSHDALKKIGPATTVIIDGDHNWYTVHGELTRLAEIADSAERTFPLVVLHDVEWPYAKRDMYYEPEAIPEKWRKPWDRRGIRWGRSRLADDGGGVNPHLANAIEEGGPRNGVLTAVEDFLAEDMVSLEMRIVRGEAGIGILVAPDLLAANPGIREQWDRLRSVEFMEEHIEHLSQDATRRIVAKLEADRKIERLEAELEQAQAMPTRQR
jgi:Methyltransferase domain